MKSNSRFTAVAAAGLACAAAAWCVWHRLRSRRVPARGKFIITADATNIEVLQGKFELDPSLWSLREKFDVVFATTEQSPRTTFQFQSCVESAAVDANTGVAPESSRAAVTIAVIEGNLRMRRGNLVPPFVLRFLNWEGFAQSQKSRDGASSSTGSMNAYGGSDSAGDMPPSSIPKRESVEGLEFGAVAGAMSDTRRRRTVEEKVMRVALDVLAPLNARSMSRPKMGVSPNRTGASSPNPDGMATAAGASVQQDSGLPVDTLFADASCSALAPLATNLGMLDHKYLSGGGSATAASEYVAALVYLMDVSTSHGERVPVPRRVADEAAARILAQHGGRCRSITTALEPILGVTVDVHNQAHLAQLLIKHSMTIGSHAINIGVAGGGPLAAGSEARCVTQLLDAGHDTAALLAFPTCAIGALYLLREIYDTALAHFGSWRMEAFTLLNLKVWDRAASKVTPSSWTRLFRSMNRSRTGEISFHEFCSFFARKLSACGDDMDPDLALVLSLARVRFTHLMFVGRVNEWSARTFWFDSLVEAHDHE